MFKFLLPLLLIANISFAQLLLPNEQPIFSFQTQKGKTVMLAKDKNNAYIIYRFGTNDKVEFEYPEKNKDSWSKFKYSYYLRGGGVENDGEDLNYVFFDNKGFRYVIYDTYRAVGEEQHVGVDVIDLSSHKTVDIKGVLKTRKGTMVDFRFDHLLPEEEDTDKVFH